MRFSQVQSFAAGCEGEVRGFAVDVADYSQVEAMASAAVEWFLASDEANCINGSTVCADDGFLQFKYPLLSS